MILKNNNRPRWQPIDNPITYAELSKKLANMPLGTLNNLLADLLGKRYTPIEALPIIRMGKQNGT